MHLNSESTSVRPLAGVTGASSGIGFALAKQFARNDYDLVIVAEDEGIEAAAQQLRAYGCNVRAVRADLTAASGVEHFVQVLKENGVLGALAINAGIGSGGEFAKTELDQELDLVDLNCRSVAHLAKRAVQMMLPAGGGRILITSSIASIAPGPYEAVYAASKAFDSSFAIALHHELKDKGITVTALMPGPTETNFFTRANMEDTKLGQQEKDDPDMVAAQAYDALMAGKDHVLAGSFKTRARATVMGAIPENAATTLHSQESKPGSGVGRP